MESNHKNNLPPLSDYGSQTLLHISELVVKLNHEIKMLIPPTVLVGFLPWI